MARITGKNAQVLGVASRTTISVAAAMHDLGAHTAYSLVITAVTYKFWNPNLPPAITKQVHGTGSFNPVSPSLYTVDYANGTITFLSANNSDDVVKINGIEYMTLSSIGNLTDWALDAKIDTVDLTAFQDDYKSKGSTFRGWSASASAYHVSSFWWDEFNGTGGANPECYFAFYPDAGTTEYWVGAGFVSDATKVKFDAAVKEDIKIEGTGQLVRLTS